MQRNGSLVRPVVDRNPQTGEIWWMGSESKPVVLTRTRRGNWKCRMGFGYFIFDNTGKMLVPTLRESTKRIHQRWNNHFIPRVDFTE